MGKRVLYRLLFSIAVGLLITMVAQPTYALRKGPDEGTEDSQEFKQLLLERDLARDRARDRLLQLSEPASDSSVTVKVRRKGDGGEERGEVIAEAKLSKEEIEKGDWGGVYKKVKAEPGSTVVSRPAAASAARSRTLGLSERERSSVWLFAGFIGLGVAVFWYSKRYQAI